jgi:hypothetical protein
MLIGAAAGVVLMGAVVAGAQMFLPLREVSRQAFVSMTGESAPRYQWRYVRDHNHPAVCVLMLTDEASGQFAMMAAPAEACD